MKYKKIDNFNIYLHNCDAIADFHVIQIYKDFLMRLSSKGIKLNMRNFAGLTEMEKRQKLNKIQNEKIA